MIKDKKPYRILVVEDNPGDLVIVEDFLTEQILFPEIVHAVNFKQAAGILQTDTAFDVVLLDLTLPDKGGRQLVSDMLRISSTCPVIILTGYTDIEFSIKSISQGILDYLLKDDLNPVTLYKSILYAIERKKAILELLASEKQYSDLFQLSPQPTCLYEQQSFRFTKVNKAAIEHYGYTEEEFLSMTVVDLIPEEERQKAGEYLRTQHRQPNQTYTGSYRNLKKNGDVIEVETFSTPIIINEKESTMIVAVDVTEKNLYEHKITKAIIKTQEDERYEIGGELHDNVCQILATSQFTLGMLKESLAPQGIPWFNKCGEYITLAAHEIRNLSHRLAPAFFNESTLESAFKILLNDFNMEDKYQTSLHFDKSVEKYSLSLEMQLNLYRILQEQLKNILKYSSASYIEVDVLICNKKLLMKTSDNGVGFDTLLAKSGIGLANMKRRAELFSGRFEINSSPGKGCVVVIEIPLPPAA